MVLFSWDEAESVLLRCAELIARSPDGLTLLTEMTVVPGVGPCLLVVAVWSGSPEGADDAMQDVRRLGTTLSDTIASVTEQDLLAQFDLHVTHGTNWSLRTRSIESLSPGVVGALIAAADRRPGPGTGIGLRHFHGAATRVGSDDTAFGQRNDHLAVEISAGWTDDDDPAPFFDWVSDVWTSLEPHALPGGYPNFLAPDQIDQVARAYGQHAPRLLRAKKRYDPDGVFTATPLPFDHS